MTTVAERTPRRLTLADRVVVALPLASVYVWLAVIYTVEAWKRATPWLFTDELEFTQLSRSIAATGHAARRGEPHSFRSLYIVLMAIPWRIHDVAAAFATIKYLDVLVMTSVLFPTYFLARLVVGRTPALFAAAGAAVIPSLSYSSWIVEETLAYPYAAFAMYVIAKALVTRSPRWAVGALAASACAPAVKGELIVIPIVLALSLVFMWWTTPRMKERRATWSRSDWLGVVTLAVGAAILISGFLSHHSHEWYSITTYYKHRIFIFGDWATGALAIGVGGLALVLGVAALAPVRGEVRTRELRVFRSVSLAGISSFWMYTAMKAAYLSTVFASRVEERNLIYISPLLFVGTAIVLERRRVNPWAFAAAAAYALYVIVGTPLYVAGGFYSDAMSLSLLGQANRYFLLGENHGRWILVAVLLVGVAGTIVMLRTRKRGAVGLAVALGVGVLAWTMAGEIAAAAGDVTVSRDIRPTLGEPFTWVDDNTHLKPTLYLAQGVTDQNPEWLLEFWNRSITTVSSLDGSVGGPGPSGAPNITTRGQLYWTLDPSAPGKTFEYAVEDWPCIDFEGTRVATHLYRGGAVNLREWRLIHLTKPNRLRAVCEGIYADGWSGPDDSTYLRFVAHRRGWLRIALSRPGPGSPVDLQVGTIDLKQNSPVFGKLVRTRHTVIPDAGRRVVWLRTPASPFAVRAVVRNKFVPSQLNPSSGDVRTLGALVGYHWFLTKR